MGISPEYFLDYMSFDAMSSLIKADNEKNKRVLEKERMGWFYTVVAQGNKIKKPSDLITFEWEKKPKRQGKRMTKDELKNTERKAKKWLTRLH